MRVASVVGFIGGVVGVIVALGVIFVATSNGDTPYAYLDASMAAAAGLLGMWGAATSSSEPRRASVALLLGGGAGFFVLGLVWIVAGTMMVTASLLIRKEIFS